MARTVGLGYQNFEQVIENNNFYIDKTLFIKEWWEYNNVVTLITRPRRFGKTLNTEIFLSTKGKKDDVDDEIKDFLAYIENSTDACAQQTSSQLVKAIHKRVTEIKLDKDMELQYMTLSQR